MWLSSKSPPPELVRALVSLSRSSAISSGHAPWLLSFYPTPQGQLWSPRTTETDLFSGKSVVFTLESFYTHVRVAVWRQSSIYAKSFRNFFVKNLSWLARELALMATRNNLGNNAQLDQRIEKLEAIEKV